MSDLKTAVADVVKKAEHNDVSDAIFVDIFIDEEGKKVISLFEEDVDGAWCRHWMDCRP